MALSFNFVGLPSAFQSWFTANIEAPILSALGYAKAGADKASFSVSTGLTNMFNGLKTSGSQIYNKLFQGLKSGTQTFTNANKRGKTFNRAWGSLTALFWPPGYGAAADPSYYVFGQPAVIWKLTQAFGSMGAVSNNATLVGWRNKLSSMWATIISYIKGTHGKATVKNPDGSTTTMTIAATVGSGLVGMKSAVSNVGAAGISGLAQSKTSSETKGLSSKMSQSKFKLSGTAV